MPAFIDLTGCVFGRLTVLNKHGNQKPTQWLCRCECGELTIINSSNLRTGNTTSCGCFNREKAGERLRTHGLSGTPEYVSWCNIKDRCYNTSNKSYNYYGGRGITMCSEWMASFEQFYTDMGPKPGPEYSIDRIDNDKGYEPGNCRWATHAEQANNQQSNRRIEFRGQEMSFNELAILTDIPRDLLYKRVHVHGMDIETAVTKEKPEPILVEHNGQKKRLSQLAQDLEIDDGTLRSRIRRGWTIERIITTPVHSLSKKKSR